jgi:hypothetical protein
MTKPIVWAENANFPAGSDAWSGTATKTAPSAGQIAAGVEPNQLLPAQWFNYMMNHFGKIATEQRFEQARALLQTQRFAGPGSGTDLGYRGVAQTHARGELETGVIWDSKSGSAPTVHFGTSRTDSSVNPANVDPLSYAAWTAIGAGALGSSEVVRAMAVAYNSTDLEVLAATSAGLRHSSGGANFANVTSYPAGAYVDAIHTVQTSGSYWLVMRSDGLIARGDELTADDTYTQVRAAVGSSTFNAWGRRIAFDPDSDTILALHETTLSVSTDNGGTWSNLTYPDDSATRKGVAIAHSRIQGETSTWFLLTRRATTSSAVSNSKLWRSTDDGATWVEVYASFAGVNEYLDKLEVVENAICMIGSSGTSGVTPNGIVSPDRGDTFHRFAMGGFGTSLELGQIGSRLAILTFDRAADVLAGPRLAASVDL